MVQYFNKIVLLLVLMMQSVLFLVASDKKGCVDPNKAAWVKIYPEEKWSKLGLVRTLYDALSECTFLNNGINDSSKPEYLIAQSKAAMKRALSDVNKKLEKSEYTSRLVCNEDRRSDGSLIGYRIVDVEEELPTYFYDSLLDLHPLIQKELKARCRYQISQAIKAGKPVNIETLLFPPNRVVRYPVIR